MPVVARDLGGLRLYGLAFSLFLTTSLLGMVLAGAWADRAGPRGPVLAGLALFAGGLVVCGAAQDFPTLLVGRAVSGAGGGLLSVSLYVVVAGVFPEAMQPRVFGYVSAAWVLPSVLGPPVAGLLAEQVSWRAVFLGVAPLCVVLGLLLLPRLRAAPAPAEASAGTGAGARVLAGTGTAAGAFAIQLGLQSGSSLGGAAGPAAVVVGVVLLAVAVPRLLPPGTLRLRRGLPSVLLTRGFYTGAFFSAETFVPLLLVEQRGLSASAAGVALTGGAVGWACGSWLQGRPGLRVERTTLLAIGLAVVAVAIGLLTLAPLPALPDQFAWPVWLVAGVGMGTGMSSTSVLTLRLSEPGEEGRNSSGLQVCDALGAVLALGVTGAVFARLHADGGAGAFSVLWAGSAAVAALGVLVALRARPR